MRRIERQKRRIDRPGRQARRTDDAGRQIEFGHINAVVRTLAVRAEIDALRSPRPRGLTRVRKRRRATATRESR